jgi:H+/Cl- antiporter ClcA
MINSSEDASMLSEHFARKNPLFFLLQWLLLALVIAVFVGSASALFLFSLDWATATRLHHHWLIWLLPFAGLPWAGSICVLAATLKRVTI